MANAVLWETDWNSALSRATFEKKNILLDFFSPN